MDEKGAIVTGIGPKDPSYFSRLLIERGYEVLRCRRPGSLFRLRGDDLRDLDMRLADLRRSVEAAP